VRFERMLARFSPQVRPIRLKVPTLKVVLKVGHHDLIQDLPVNGGILDRNEGLNSAIQVSRHPVGGR